MEGSGKIRSKHTENVRRNPRGPAQSATSLRGDFVARSTPVACSQEQGMNQLWTVEMLGGLQARQEDRVIARFKTYKTGTLLAFLSCFLHRAHPREELIERFWPDVTLEQGRPSLSVALSSLRHQLEPPGVASGSVIVADHASVRLNPLAVTTDVALFEEPLRSEETTLERLEGAAALYRGEFLPGRYDDWCVAERERLAELHIQALRRAAMKLVERRDPARALEYILQALRFDQMREEICRDAMRLYVALGQPGAALRQYQELEALLRSEVNAAPAAATRQLAREIEQRRSEVAPPVREPPHTATAHEKATALRRVAEAPEQPAGACTGLFITCESSVAGALRAQLDRHLTAHGGRAARRPGGHRYLFGASADALSCAMAIHRALTAESHPAATEQGDGAGAASIDPSFRMALHTWELGARPVSDGEGEGSDGPDSDEGWRSGARLLAAAREGQILCSEETAALLRRGLDPGCRLAALGRFRLEGESAPLELFEARYPGMSTKALQQPHAAPGLVGSLPHSFTRFVGRARELARLVELAAGADIGEQTEGSPRIEPVGSAERTAARLPSTNMLAASPDRLITITGPGGTGKTRIALEAARRVAPSLQGAVWFVQLAEVTDPELVPDAVRTAMRLHALSSGDPWAAICDALGAQPALLVLDNLEQLVEGAGPQVRQLLERSPNLRCLVTSRRILGIEGEREFALAPLPIPSGREPIEALAECESVALFVDRAQSVKPDFQVTAANARTVADLCARLEGIPLAIELAAAWAQALTPAQMLERVAHRFDLLSGRRRDREERHRTLRATIDWSYRLLSPEMRELFARLSVFQGGWSLEAAELVCEAPMALDWLVQLRECSLVLNDSADAEVGEIRFRMLETLRDYGRECVPESDRERLSLRHAEFYRALAERANAHPGGPGAEIWRARLRADEENLRLAIDRYLAAGSADSAATVAVALSDVWERRGQLDTGRRLLGQCLAQAASLRDVSLRSRLMSDAGWFAYLQGEYPAAAGLIGESLDLSRQSGDRDREAVALNNLALVTQAQNDLPQAHRLFEESLALARLLNDSGKQAVRLSNLGLLHAHEQDYGRARACFEEALSTFRGDGNTAGMAACLCNLGDLALRSRDWEESAAWSAEALRLFRAGDDRPGIVYTQTNLAEAGLQLGDSAGASSALQEAQAGAAELRLGHLQPLLLEIRARCEAAAGRLREGAHWLAVAEALREQAGLARSAEEEARLEPLGAALKEALSEAQRLAIRARVAGMPLEALLAGRPIREKETRIEH
jgi:predicted ATPase/DNA-binding SARP family transcriptional activator